jgi:hypothetical protein
VIWFLFFQISVTKIVNSHSEAVFRECGDFMANRTATLYIRIKTEDGRNPHCLPVYITKGRLKPLYATVDGKPEYRPEGS